MKLHLHLQQAIRRHLDLRLHSHRSSVLIILFLSTVASSSSSYDRYLASPLHRRLIYIFSDNIRVMCNIILIFILSFICIFISNISLFRFIFSFTFIFCLRRLIVGRNFELFYKCVYILQRVQCGRSARCDMCVETNYLAERQRIKEEVFERFLACWE